MVVRDLEMIYAPYAPCSTNLCVINFYFKKLKIITEMIITGLVISLQDHFTKTLIVSWSII